MRKLVVAASFMFLAAPALQAQKLDDVQEKFQKGKYDEAKEKIDKVLEDPKNQGNANAWYWKGNVYAQLAKQDTLNQLSYDAAHEAFLAYKKYQELDPKNVMMALEQNVGLFMLRDAYATKGDQFWNQKEYKKAFENFKKALAVQDYINSKGFSYNNFSYPQLDTVLVRYTAAAAYSAKMEDEAMPFFEKLADAKIGDADFKDIYGLLVQYHMQKGNTERADKYLAMGRELFKDEDYWLSVEIGELGVKERDEIDRLREEMEKDPAKKDANEKKIAELEDQMKRNRIARLKQLSVKYPNNAALALDYAIELRNDAFIWDKKPADYNARKEAYVDAMKKAASLNASSQLAAYLLSEYYYIHISDLEEEARAIRGTAAADVAKKKEINAKVDAVYENLHEASLKAYELYSSDSNLKIQDKANYRKVLNQLVDYYTRKKNTERVTFYQNKLKSL